MINKKPLPKESLLYLFICVFAFFPAVSFSQVIQPTNLEISDTIPSSVLRERATTFQNQVKGRKTSLSTNNIPESVKFSVAQLRDIVNNLTDDDSLVFKFVPLTYSDASRYPSADTEAKKRDIVGKLSLVVKVKTATANNKGLGDIIVMGTICPPPGGSCD